jgi:hypothetical protein
VEDGGATHRLRRQQEGMTAAGDGGVRRWWCRAEAGESSSVHGKGAKWRRASSVRGTRGDKLPVHVGQWRRPAATGHKAALAGPVPGCPVKRVPGPLACGAAQV